MTWEQWRQFGYGLATAAGLVLFVIMLAVYIA